jgi:anti-sigma B factor antagonist
MAPIHSTAQLVEAGGLHGDGFPLSWRVTTEGGRTLIRLTGELDLATAPELLARVEPLAATGRTVVLDLSELTFCDSSGFNAFVRLQRRCRNNGTDLVLHAPPPTLMRVLQLAYADHMFRVEP